MLLNDGFLYDQRSAVNTVGAHMETNELLVHYTHKHISILPSSPFLLTHWRIIVFLNHSSGKSGSSLPCETCCHQHFLKVCEWQRREPMRNLTRGGWWVGGTERRTAQVKMLNYSIGGRDGEEPAECEPTGMVGHNEWLSHTWWADDDISHESVKPSGVVPFSSRWLGLEVHQCDVRRCPECSAGFRWSHRVLDIRLIFNHLKHNWVTPSLPFGLWGIRKMKVKEIHTIPVLNILDYLIIYRFWFWFCLRTLLFYKIMRTSLQFLSLRTHTHTHLFQSCISPLEATEM